MNWYHVRPHDGYGWKVESFPDVRPHQEVRVRRMVDMPDAAGRLEPGPMIIMWNDPDRQYGTVYGRHEWLQFNTSGAANTWVRRTEAELSALDAQPPFLVIVEANDDVAQNRLATEQDHEAFEEECFEAGCRAFREGTPLHGIELPRTVPMFYNGDHARQRVLSGYLATMRSQVVAMTEAMNEQARRESSRRRSRVRSDREDAVEYAAGGVVGTSPAADFAEIERRMLVSLALDRGHLVPEGGGDPVYDEHVETEQIEDQLGAPRGSTRRMIEMALAYGAGSEVTNRIARRRTARSLHRDIIERSGRRRREGSRRRGPPPDPERDIDL